MSEFSKLFSQIIKARDVNVSALTGYCGLDRSTMYKLINGKRNPSSKELVRKISEHLSLNPREAQELMDAYEMTRVGSETYLRRRSVQDFILNFRSIQKNRQSGLATVSISREAISGIYDENKKTFPLNGRFELSAMIHRIFLIEASGKECHISILAQPEHLEALDIAASIPVSYGDVKPNAEIRNIICINNVKNFIRSQENYNLQCLKRILPFYNTGYQYEPRYYYDDINAHFGDFNFMPCVFLTREAAVICSGDLTEGICFREEQVVAQIREYFDRSWEKASPMLLSFESSLEFHFQKFPVLVSSCRDSYILGFGPCLSSCLTPDLVEKYVKRDLPDRENFIEQANQYLASVGKIWAHNFFSRDGIKSFLETGIIEEIPPEIYQPLDYPDRVRVLKKYCALIGSGRKIRMFKNEMEHFPRNFHLFVSAGFGYLQFSSGEGRYYYLLLEEQSLLNAFYDFSVFLEESTILYSEEETKKFLKECIC